MYLFVGVFLYVCVCMFVFLSLLMHIIMCVSSSVPCIRNGGEM